MLVWKSDLLTGVKGVVHGVSTRLGGVSRHPYATLNLGLHTEDRWKTSSKTAAGFLERLGVSLDASVSAEQVHGAGVAHVDSRSAGRGARSYADSVPGVDALVTTEPGLILLAYLRIACRSSWPPGTGVPSLSLMPDGGERSLESLLRVSRRSIALRRRLQTNLRRRTRPVHPAVLLRSE